MVEHVALEVPWAWRGVGPWHNSDVVLRVLLLSLSAPRAADGGFCSSPEHPILPSASQAILDEDTTAEVIPLPSPGWGVTLEIAMSSL